MLAPVAADDPLVGLVRLHRAALTDQAGHPEDALHQLEQIARDYPTRPEPYASQGDILRTQHRFADAVVAYDKAVARVRRRRGRIGRCSTTAASRWNARRRGRAPRATS